MSPPETGSLPPEPRACTLADLVLLVLGAALAAGLPWSSYSGPARTILGAEAPGWFLTLNFAVESYQKGCEALIPVILHRRWRYGGPIRPGEYLPILIGLPAIVFSASKWPILGLYRAEPGAPGVLMAQVGRHQVWRFAQVAVGLAAVTMLIVRRRRPRDWVAGGLIAVAWSRLTEQGGAWYGRRAFGLLGAYRPDLSIPALRGISTVLVAWPRSVVNDVPLTVAIVDLRGRDPRRLTWVEWAGYAAGVGYPILIEARYEAQQVVGTGSTDWWGPASRVAGLAASYALARWSEPAWRRLLGLPVRGPSAGLAPPPP